MTKTLGVQKLNSPSVYPILCPLVNWILLFFAACPAGQVPDADPANVGQCTRKSFDISNYNSLVYCKWVPNSLRPDEQSESFFYSSQEFVCLDKIFGEENAPVANFCS